VAGRLIVAVSEINDDTRTDVERFCAELDTRSVPASLLVTPRARRGYRLVDDADTVAWLTGRRAGGDAIVLHGYDATVGRRRGEFAALPAHEAHLRLLAADRVLEQTGLRTRLFAAGAVSSGALRALTRNGFRLLVTRSAITDLVRGTTVRVRELRLGPGLLSEPWRCRALVLAAERAARRGGSVRIAVTGGQLRNAAMYRAVLDAIDLALLHRCTPTVYRWPGPPASGTPRPLPAAA